MEPAAESVVHRSTPPELSDLKTFGNESSVSAPAEPEHNREKPTDQSSHQEDSPDTEEDENASTRQTRSTSPNRGLRVVSKVASLWCPRTSRSHGSLYDWHILKYPACGQLLQSPRCAEKDIPRGRRITSSSAPLPASSGPLASKPPAGTYATNLSSECSTRSSSPFSHFGTRGPPGPPRPPPLQVPAHNPFGMDPHVPFLPLTGNDARLGRPDVRYQILFLYSSGREIGSRPYHELLDLQKERDAIVNNRDPTFRIRTVIQTNIKEDISPYTKDQTSRRIMGEGILRNPKYDVEVISEDIKIPSRRIIDVLKQLSTYYPGIVLTGDDVTLEEPYVFAFHNMEKIKSYQQDRLDEETRRQLRVLCDAVELKHGLNVDQEMARYAAPIPKATFKMLWLLFKPGDTVYTQMNGGGRHVF
ncbi:hypothetical protein PG988_000008 [Apiospora saccharicola]